MSAMVKNGDLLPDCEGHVTKEQVFEAMLRIGISAKVAHATSNANFDHLAEKSLFLWGMNTITTGEGGSTARGNAPEHFRSTGIRDAADGRPDKRRYAIWHGFRRIADSVTGFGFLTQAEVTRAIAAFDVDPGEVNIYGERGVHSNDVNLEHPARAAGCGPSDSVATMQLTDDQPDETSPCFSNLHGSITFMFQEMGTPTGPKAILSDVEMRALWLNGEYPHGFKQRSPSRCVGGEYGCESCWHDYTESAGQPRDAQKARYCRCMRARDYVLSGGLNSTAEEIVLPGVMSQLSPEYVATCTRDEDDDAGRSCSPFCFAGGGEAKGSFDRRWPQSTAIPPAVP